MITILLWFGVKFVLVYWFLDHRDLNDLYRGSILLGFRFENFLAQFHGFRFTLFPNFKEIEVPQLNQNPS